MKVSELINKLEEFHPDLNVIISIDQEGNAYFPVEIVEKEAAYYDIHQIEIIHHDEISDFKEDELEPVVVIWP